MLRTVALDTTGSRIPIRPSFRSDLVQPFTLPGTNRGGRTARKGYAFQDWWIAYHLLGSLSQSDELAYARIEGVEDLDLILRRDELWIERYVQVKSKEEGTGNWTLRSLEHEILPRFYKLFRDFRATPHDASRRIELLLVVEGDLAKQVLSLKQIENTSKAFVFALITSIEIVNTSPEYQAVSHIIQDFLSKWSAEFLTGRSDSEQVSWDELFQEIDQHTALSKQEIRDTVQGAAAATLQFLEEFVNALEFQSRAPGVDLLREAAVQRLMAAVDIGVLEANNALDRLVQSIANESKRPTCSLVDRDTLLSWLQLKPKPPLRSKPEVVSDYVERKEFTEKFSKIL